MALFTRFMQLPRLLRVLALPGCSTASVLVVVCCSLVFPSGSVLAHSFVPEGFRLGAYPPYDGGGWAAEVYLAIPDESAIHLLAAEAYVAPPLSPPREPDFTFHTDWIDFPSGPVAIDLDANFETIGDFLGDAITDVSDPSKLNEPFGHFLIRFTGFLKVTVAEDTIDSVGLPVWVDFGTMGYDGFRLLVGSTIYRFPIVSIPNFFWQENPILEALGMYRIEFTYFNRYDPNGELGAELAGVELYSWHGGGLPWPTGERMIHERFGPGTLVPPRVIYQEQDIVPMILGDFNADSFVDMRDFHWFQTCFSGPNTGGFFLLGTGCHNFDFDDEVDVDLNDFSVFWNALNP